MKLINIGFGNMVSANRLVAIVSPESAPIKRIIADARERGSLIDATYGRRTRAVIITDSDHVILSAVQPETVANVWTTMMRRNWKRMSKKGQLIVVSGPSGVGKGTVLGAYLAGRENVAYSVSATTRAPRPGEQDGVHYFFLSREEFESTAQNGGMLEYASYNGNYYGTPKAPVEQKRAQGIDVILEIEVQGALQVKKACPDALMIFVAPPGFDELQSRLTGRHTEDEETVQKRLAIARQELKQAYHYDYVVVNDTVSQAVDRLSLIVEANRLNIHNMKEFLDEVNHNA